MKQSYREDRGSDNDSGSNPQSQTLYAKKSARQEDSMTFVRRNPNPMNVKNMNAVNATPRSVEVKGLVAADPYDYESNT
jgi:hypothetical protein